MILSVTISILANCSPFHKRAPTRSSDSFQQDVAPSCDWIPSAGQLTLKIRFYFCRQILFMWRSVWLHPGHLRLAQKGVGWRETAELVQHASVQRKLKHRTAVLCTGCSWQTCQVIRAVSCLIRNNSRYTLAVMYHTRNSLSNSILEKHPIFLFCFLCFYDCHEDKAQQSLCSAF